MTTRREIEQALAGKSSNELNDFFDSLGFYKVNPGGATNEEKRREGILKYNLDLADKKRDRFTKICRGLDLPTPEERMLEIEDARREREERATPSPPAMSEPNDISTMKRHLDSLSPNDVTDFYRDVFDKRDVVLYTGQRDDFAAEILELKQRDPGRWIKACRLSRTETNTTLPVSSTNTTLPVSATTVPSSRIRDWLREHSNAIIVTVIGTVVGGLVLAFLLGLG